jgi:hypothetical protein
VEGSVACQFNVKTNSSNTTTEYANATIVKINKYEQCGELTGWDDAQKGQKWTKLQPPRAWCAFSGRNLHSRMPLDPTPARLK